MPASSRLIAIAFLCIAAVGCSDTSNTPTSPFAAHDPARHSTDPSNFQLALAPQHLVRSKGAPDVFSFTIAGYGPAAILHIQNGNAAGADRVSSATVTLDGLIVAGPDAFSQKVTSIDLPIQLGNPSVLQIQMASAPGSELTISVTAAGATAATVPPTGGDIHLLGQQTTLTVPAGAAPPGLEITAAPVTTDQTQPANANVVGGSTVDFGPTGTQFTSPITISLHYDPTRQPQGLNEKALRLATLVNGQWVEIKGSTVDPTTHVVTGQTTHFSTYGVVAFQTFTQITVGDRFACGLTAQGAAYCWGANGNSQLGSPTTQTCVPANPANPPVPCALTPQAVTGGLTFTSISAGGTHACGVTGAGDGYCWGDNGAGRLGDGTSIMHSAPSLVAGGLKWSTIVTGPNHTCGLTPAGDIYCWGGNGAGQLGATTSSTCTVSTSTGPCSLVPIRVQSAQQFKQITLGLSTTCALTSDDQPLCWGDNTFLALGDPTVKTNRLAPGPVTGGFSFDQIALGGLSGCGLTNQTTYCWGTNSPFRLLGIGKAPNSSTPVPLGGALSVQALALATSNSVFDHACALTTDGSLWCWGGNDALQLGVSTANESCTVPNFQGDLFTFACNNVPVQASVSAGPFKSVAVAAEETCANAVDGQTYCWGSNIFGQIGDGTTGAQRTFTVVPRP